MQTSTHTHTPGPWSIDKPYGETGLYVQAADTSLICKLYPVDDGRWVRDKTTSSAANARLIAAAPALLDALRRFTTIPCHHTGNIHCTMRPRTPAFRYCAPCEARAAIAAATGEDV